MTSFSRFLIATLALLWAGVAATAHPEQARSSTIEMDVDGLVCAFCAQGIEKRLQKMPATKAVFVDLKQKIVAVEAKDGQKLDGKAITAEITDAGYDVVKLEPVAGTVADVRTAAKAGK